MLIPIKSPSMDEASTRIKASYIYIRYILNFVNPMALITPISFAYSYKFALIDELNEKKHRNIVIIIITLNIHLRMLSKYV